MTRPYLVALANLAMLWIAPAALAHSGQDPATSPIHPPSAVDDRIAARGEPTEDHDDLTTRGKYIAIEADCASCHTAPGGKPYAGGYPLKSPLGTLYGPNITPDPATGIGQWTKADFVKALRQGVGKDGSYLYPAMPYENYTKMTDADMDALWAYMRSVPPVNHTPPQDDLPFPFNVRTGIALWQSVYFRPGPFTPNPSKSARWNRGAYLIEAMGHCDQCHTPRNVAQAMQTKHDLAGAKISGWYAPDISNDAGSEINHWSAEQLVKFFKDGRTGNSVAVGPMSEAIHDSLRLMTNADLEAMAVYLKDQPPSEPVAADKVKWPQERADAGRLVYQNHCASCHQANGKGIPGSVPALAGSGAVTAKQPYNVVMAVLEGFEPRGTWGAMGSFAQVLSDEQIADVVNYVRTAWGNPSLPNATPWGVEHWRKNADAAPAGETRALLCPSLAAPVLQPALKARNEDLQHAADDSAIMAKLVADYRVARPRSSSAEVIEALSTAYCRNLSKDRISEAVMSERLSDFAEQAASALGKHAKHSALDEKNTALNERKSAPVHPAPREPA